MQEGRVRRGEMDAQAQTQAKRGAWVLLGTHKKWLFIMQAAAKAVNA